MKKNILKYICGLASLLMVACSSDDFSDVKLADKDAFAYVDGDKVVVNVSLDAPDMANIQSRGLSEKPDYSDLHLYLVEFDDNGSPLRNTLRTVYTPESETPHADKVLYKVILDKSAQPRVLHLIALPKDKDLTLDYGIEATIIPNLKTDNQTPAYWRRLSFPNGYVKEGTDEESSELAQLKSVALVRNFSCISVTNEADKFELKGFAIVNNPEVGTVAPWILSKSTFPDFLNGVQEPIDYKTIAANYSGIVPTDVKFSNPEAGPVVNDDVNPKYLYERPFNSIRHTYVIIKGRRTGDTEDSYYKLDLGKNDDKGIFRYYGLLRNYKFNIILRKVDAKGYGKVLEAAQGVVYNNFSFDIEVASMLNISDGQEVVYVNFTTAVLTDPNSQTLDFKYRYRSLSSSSPTYNNDNVNFVGLEPGDVIEKVDYSTSNDADGWRNVKITCYPAQTETKTQSFTIVKESGLGRTVNLILHRKWTLANVKEFAGTHENWDALTSGEGTAGPKAGDDLTIFFDIPDNLEEAMFPLTFTLEADRQNIENNPLGKLIVTSGTSGFPGIQGSRIKYQKNVSWTEYNDPLIANPEDNGTVIDNGDGTKTHRIRCRFRTITALDNLDLTGSVTTVLITNDNFNNAEVKFTRRQ